MGLFSNIFKSNEQSEKLVDEETRQIASLTGCECIPVNAAPNSDRMMELYLSEYEKGRKEGYVPVILIANGHLLEMIECNYEDSGDAEEYRNDMLKADISHGKEFLKRRFDENMEMYNEDFEGVDIYGEYLENAKPETRFLGVDKNPKCLIMRIPAENPWEVFAWIPFGGWNECPDTEDLMAVCKYWHEKYSAVPAFISSDELQMYVPTPVNNIDEALKIAEEHYAFCNDTVDQGTETIKALASMIMNSSVWYFWWD